ncbi:MAG TPA: hypothetical protein VGD98_18575 [Ktedonobacteraceae bacterium]
MPIDKYTSQDLFQLGQSVLDADGNRIGKIQARFERHMLVESGGLFGRAYYIPRSQVRINGEGSAFVNVSKAELRKTNWHNVPDDLYNDVSEPGAPQIFSGVPKFAKHPVSPAQTGHYNYGRRSPGINTDAGGSYHHEEILPIPQNLVKPSEENRRKA